MPEWRLHPWQLLMRSARVALTALLAAACAGPQSALSPAGRDAAWIANLTLVMAVAFGLIWAGVVALAAYAPYARTPRSPRFNVLLVAGGGVAFPAVVLLALMTAGLWELPTILSPAPDRNLALEINGRQWWWRVKYLRPGREPVELANEVWLPRGRRIDARLASNDVIHSFWLPAVAGKMDLIPGRVNRLSLEPTRTGTFRGACAEFCGTSHAWMNFVAIVVSPDEFERWLEEQARPAAAPVDAAAQRGEAAFFERGCNTCHTVRGTIAQGVEGPDLTHVGSRQTIAAGLLPRTPENFERWIAGTEVLKPGAHMPAFRDLPPDTLAALAAYLTGLR